MTHSDEEHQFHAQGEPLADGFICGCSCGKWRKTFSFYDFENRDTLIAAARSEHSEHGRAATKEGSHGG